jgi:hypothetical protein
MRYFLILAALAFATSASAAALPDQCDKYHGEITCDDPVGNSENSDGQSQSVTNTSRGNLTNKQECSGPGAGGSTAGC